MRITDEDKLNYGPACRDYFWLMCRLVNCLPNDIIQGKMWKYEFNDMHI